MDFKQYKIINFIKKTMDKFEHFKEKMVFSGANQFLFI